MNTNELQQYHARLAIEDRNETQGLSCLIDTQEQESSQTYCYKPYRTLNNY